MNNILVDSSVWIEYFKSYKAYAFIDNLINNNLICTNDIIFTELLPSMIHKKENHLVTLMKSIFKYEIKINWKELQDIQSTNYKHGFNDIGITDLIIAQNCIQNNLILVARDKHFNEMAGYLPLKIY
jgi:predicted nucleic acid-binding protein